MRSWHMPATAPIAASRGWRESTRSVRYGTVRTRSRSMADSGAGLVPDPGGDADGAESVDEAGPLDQRRRPPPAARPPAAAGGERRDRARVPEEPRRLQVGVVGEDLQRGRRARRRRAAGPAPRTRRSTTLQASIVVEVGEDLVGVARRQVDQRRVELGAAPVAEHLAAPPVPPTRQKTSTSSATCTIRIDRFDPVAAQPGRGRPCRPSARTPAAARGATSAPGRAGRRCRRWSGSG